MQLPSCATAIVHINVKRMCRVHFHDRVPRTAERYSSRRSASFRRRRRLRSGYCVFVRSAERANLRRAERLRTACPLRTRQSAAYERSTEANNARANRNTCGVRLNEVATSEACDLNVAVVSVTCRTNLKRMEVGYAKSGEVGWHRRDPNRRTSSLELPGEVTGLWEFGWVTRVHVLNRISFNDDRARVSRPEPL